MFRLDATSSCNDCTKRLHALHTVGSVVYMQNMWLDKCVCVWGGGLPLCADLHQRITSGTVLLKVL